MTKIIDVDAKGIDKDANEYQWVATAEMVRSGNAINVPVRLRYPDGRTVSANEVRITQKGLAALRAAMG